jgi:hypothetical protein
VLTKRNIGQPVWQFIDHIRNVFVWCHLKKTPLALPGAAIARIHHPESFFRQKFRQRLFARNRRKTITKNDNFCFLALARGWKKFRDDFLFETGSKHMRRMSICFGR